MSNGLPILLGLDSIVNPDNIKPGMDLKELERQMVKNGMVEAVVQDPADRLNDELRIAARKLDIDLGGEDEVDSRYGDDRYGDDRYGSYTHAEPVYTPTNEEYSHPAVDTPSPYSRNYSQSNSSNSSNSHDQSYNPSNSSNSHDQSYNSSYNSSHNSSTYPTHTNTDSPSRTPIFNSTGGSSYNNDSILSRTLEEERRTHINKIVGNDDNVSFSLEKEKKEDLKCAMLAEIDSLISSLQMEEVDLSRIPQVGNDSTYELVESTLKILRHKNDQTRACTFMEEFLMFGAYGLEELFDGKRVWLGRFSPDLTGWHNHLNVKLRRVRYDTGQFTSSMLEKYKIGPGTRMAFEIVPNLFLYSRMRKQQHDQPNLLSEVDDNEVEQATARISSL